MNSFPPRRRLFFLWAMEFRVEPRGHVRSENNFSEESLWNTQKSLDNAELPPGNLTLVNLKDALDSSSRKENP